MLSAFTVKSGAYAYPVVPVWAALAALGADRIARGDRAPLVVLVLAALASAPPLLTRLGVASLPLPVWLGAWLALAVGLVIARWRPAWSRAVAVTLVMFPIVLGMVRVRQRLLPPFHATGYRAVATAIAPLLADVPPARSCYVAPEAPAFSFYLFRSGRYWATPSWPWDARRLAEVQADSALRVFIVDPTRALYGGWPDEPTLRWLESSTREVTAELAARVGRPLELRVFVRRREGAH